MLKLIGRADASGVVGPLADDVWRIQLPGDPISVHDERSAKSVACLVKPGESMPTGYGLYVTTESWAEAVLPSEAPGAVLKLGSELAHLGSGDIIHVPPGGRRVTVLWKNSAQHNGLLLTEQCDNYCLMCSQPPKERDDSWLFDRARKVISLLPMDAGSLSLTGGEPTLHADALIELLEHCRRVAPELSVHLLSNGRRFADPAFARRYASVGLADIMVGIPVYAPEPALHDFVVQAAGAFDETIHGVLNLASLGQAVELRVVIQRHTVPVLVGLATFIARNLPFVAQVALMGLEMTGLARPNSALVWADPADYQRELAEAVDILTAAGIATGIYNHQLCVLDRRLWPYAIRSISDWKNDYLDICRSCSVRDACGGVFTTSGNRLSQHLHPLA
ncbi:MAG TPA: His-Xaa-Ser system radical SAM maturase HxsC [Trebonia sp.]|nr:His-Xaa-Ser system radical SAM maturase HxsC [Trebonia sp.]